MASAIGWYGPLIDLSEASSHVTQFVQLLVFLHRCTPLQSVGGEAIRTHVQVGDETRPFFFVTLWGKAMASACTLAPGDIILLQNVVIVKYGTSVEAKTVQQSSIVRLIHSSELLFFEGVEALMKHVRVGISTKEKFKRMIEWVHKTKPPIHSISRIHNHKDGLNAVNWKKHEGTKKFQHCSSLFEVKNLDISCKATFFASVGEIFLPSTTKVDALDKQSMFLSRKICTHNLVEDVICTGCQLCGSPLGFDQGSEQKKADVPLYCPESSDRLHVLSFIYRPFMLYVWDEVEYVPVLVKNTAATHLFGNIKADKVYTSYKRSQSLETCSASKELHSMGCTKSSTPDANRNSQSSKSINIFFIWLTLLRVLLKQGKHAPLRFLVDVNTDLDKGKGYRTRVLWLVLQRISLLLVSFLWNSGQEKRHHWVRWSSIGHPTSEGGLGFRSLSQIMEGLHTKLAWRFWEQKSFWTRFMTSKYGHPMLISSSPNNGLIVWFNIRPYVLLLRPWVSWVLISLPSVYRIRGLQDLTYFPRQVPYLYTEIPTE
uniref:Uncharacterized protein n=1 Tax=Kalanchoe fedtschenkoi TaxID=63787 RepID=A0A7N0TSE1_KALFE